MTLNDFNAKAIDGTDVPLSNFRGKVVLVVNVASKCGFTPQYAGLQELYDRYEQSGFAVLGFPCNQFREQEPGSDAEIKAFCGTRYNVSFPMFSKIDVNGPNAHPIFEFLKTSLPGFLGSRRIKWNFTKFLIDRTGNPRKRYSPQTSPSAIAKDIEQALLLPRVLGRSAAT
jgi:glutathione peroxidase